MKNAILRWGIALAVTAGLMIAAPQFFPLTGGQEAMSNLFALWYVVNPIFCVAAGALAGFFISDMWPFPVMPPLLFLVGVWAAQGAPLPTTYVQAGSYFGFGLIAMLVVGLIRYRRAHRDDYYR